MIDISQERVLSFAEAADVLPRRRGRKKPHVATLYRWSQRGCRGVQLETIQVGGTKCTSVEALQRFFQQLSGPASVGGAGPGRLELGKTATDAIERQLEREGL